MSVKSLNRDFFDEVGKTTPGKYYLYALPGYWTMVARLVKHVNLAETLIDNAIYFTTPGATFDTLTTQGLVESSVGHYVGTILVPAAGIKFPWPQPTPWAKKVSPNRDAFSPEGNLVPGEFYLYCLPGYWTMIARYVRHSSPLEMLVEDAAYFTNTGATFDILMTQGLAGGSKCHPVGTLSVPSGGLKFPWRQPVPWAK